MTQVAGPELVRAAIYERRAPARSRRFRRDTGATPTRKGTRT